MFLARLFAKPYLLLTLTTLIWGGNAIASRLAVGEVTPAVLVSFRWIGVVILVVLFARGAVDGQRSDPCMLRDIGKATNGNSPC